MDSTIEKHLNTYDQIQLSFDKKRISSLSSSRFPNAPPFLLLPSSFSDASVLARQNIGKYNTTQTRYGTLTLKRSKLKKRLRPLRSSAIVEHLWQTESDIKIVITHILKSVRVPSRSVPELRYFHVILPIYLNSQIRS